MITYPKLLPATSAFLSRPAKMLVGGQWLEAASGQTLDSLDPATGETLASFPAGGEVDANEAVRAARRAFPAWKRISPHDRGRMLYRAAALIEENEDELAELITLENGQPR